MTVSGKPDTPAIEVIGLYKAFSGFVALHSVSLNIPQNEFFSLLGPSGCGKTTLLRIIGGFEAPTRGDVRLHGRSVLDEPPYRRKTNMVFQHLALFPHLSVIKNITFPLEMKKIPEAEARKKAGDLLDMVQLSGMEDRKVDQLSGGQRQRVAIARALVGSPEVLLLDEPLGALDLKLRLQMQEELRRLQKAVGSTFVFVTHDQAEAITMSDRIAVMHGGHVMQIGTPHDIYETPSCRFVAEFIGQSNLMKGRVADVCSEAECAVEIDGRRLVGRSRGKLESGKPVTVAARYEKVKVSRCVANEAGPNGFPAIVSERKYLGSTVRISMSAFQGLVLHADISPEAEAAGCAPGDAVIAMIEPRNLLVLAE